LKMKRMLTRKLMLEWMRTKSCEEEGNVFRIVSPYRFLLTDDSVRKKSPGTLIFVFDHETVPMYRTYVLCTRERRNISLIEM
jgi:hypothetical protein